MHPRAQCPLEQKVLAIFHFHSLSRCFTFDPVYLSQLSGLRMPLRWNIPYKFCPAWNLTQDLDEAVQYTAPHRRNQYNHTNAVFSSVLSVLQKQIYAFPECCRSPLQHEHVRPSGLLCRWPNGLELTARQALRPIAIDWQFPSPA